MRARVLACTLPFLLLVLAVFLLSGGSRDAAKSEAPPPRAAADAASPAPPEPPVLAPRQRALSGRVVDERGLPIPDAEIVAAARLESRRSSADASGHFVVELPQAGTWQVAASAAGRLPTEQAFQVPDEGLEVEITLRAGGALGGRVRAGRSDPDHYRVTLEDAAGEELQARCDGRGEYRFDALAPGAYRVHLDSSARRWPEVGRIDIRAGESATFDIEAPASGALEIHALLPAEWAGRAQRVQLELLHLESGRESRHALQLGSDGRARLEDLASGRYTARIVADPSTPSHSVPLEVRAGSTADVTLSWAQGRVEGRVIDASGKGVVQATVRVQPLRARDGSAVPDSGSTYETLSDPDGGYRLVGLPPGEYLVSTRSGGYASGRVLVSETGATEQELRLSAAHELEVHVEAQGAPLAGVVVFALRAPYSDWLAQAETDARGTARLTGLTAGTYRLVARVLSGADLRTASAEARIGAGSTQPVVLDVD